MQRCKENTRLKKTLVVYLLHLYLQKSLNVEKNGTKTTYLPEQPWWEQSRQACEVTLPPEKLEFEHTRKVIITHKSNGIKFYLCNKMTQDSGWHLRLE